MAKNSKNDTKKQLKKYDDEHLQAVDNLRAEYLKNYQKVDWIRYLVLAIGLGLVLFGAIGVPNISGKASWGTPIMIACIILGMGAMLTYSTISKGNARKKMRKYFVDFYTETNKFVFDNEVYNAVELQTPNQINKTLFDENGLFTNVAEVGSRGLTNFIYHGIHCSVCDCAAQYKADKRMMPLYVGKYVIADCKYDGSEPIYIYIKGDRRALPPNAINEVPIVEETKDYVIRTNLKSLKGVFTLEMKKLLSKIEVNKEFVDCAITIKNKKVYICMGYDDPIMIIPLEKQLLDEPWKLFKEDLLHVCEFIEGLQ